MFEKIVVIESFNNKGTCQAKVKKMIETGYIVIGFTFNSVSQQYDVMFLKHEV